MAVDVYPVDLTSAIGRVRKYIPDLEQLADPADPDGDVSFIFTDPEIQSFLDDETADGAFEVTSFRVRRAAAWAMIAIANSENLILKKIITQDQQTDGPAVSKALQTAASLLFERAQAEETALTSASMTEGLLAVFPGQTHAPEYPSYHGTVLVRPYL